MSGPQNTIVGTVFGRATDRDTGHSYRFRKHINATYDIDSDFVSAVQNDLESMDPNTTFVVDGWGTY